MKGRLEGDALRQVRLLEFLPFAFGGQGRIGFRDQVQDPPPDHQVRLADADDALEGLQLGLVGGLLVPQIVHSQPVQPVREKTGGSTFTNPDPPGTPNQRSAWRLIDAAGCRGMTIGGAQVSPMHCNFLVNTGTATAYDLELLGETVRARVLEATGVLLTWEIKRLGAFAPSPQERSGGR